MNIKLEYDYELPIYQVELIHKDGTSEKSLPSRMTLEFAKAMAKNTINSEERLVDYKIIKMTEKEASLWDKGVCNK